MKKQQSLEMCIRMHIRIGACDTCRMCTWLSSDLSSIFTEFGFLNLTMDYLLTQFTFRDIAHLSDFKVQTSRLFRASCGDELEVLQLCGADVPTHVVTFIQGIKLIKFAFCVLNKKHSLCLRSSL